MQIAPCGMNCFLCAAYQRDKNRCAGCSAPDKQKVKHCTTCYIRNCGEIQNSSSGFCYYCINFPCRRLKQLDKRYQLKYGMSMIRNLKEIESLGLEMFVQMEIIKWTCRKCGSLLSVHRGKCLKCGENNEYFPGSGEIL
jgi:hypothetical protein